MELKEFIQNFADQFDDTDTSVFTQETKFKELEEWSSLTALSVIAMIDEEYDVKIRVTMCVIRKRSMIFTQSLNPVSDGFSGISECTDLRHLSRSSEACGVQ